MSLVTRAVMGFFNGQRLLYECEYYFTDFSYCGERLLSLVIKPRYMLIAPKNRGSLYRSTDGAEHIFWLYPRGRYAGVSSCNIGN